MSSLSAYDNLAIAFRVSTDPASTATCPQLRDSTRAAARHLLLCFLGNNFSLCDFDDSLCRIPFLTGAGAAFLVGVSHRPATTSTAAAQNLPALTETEIEQARSLVTGLNTRTDDIEGTTWYSPDPADNYKTAVYLYIGQKQTGQPWLRWKIRYYGEDWLFIRRYRVKIDDAEAVTVQPTRDIKRDNSGGSVWETFDEPASKHAHLLNQILAGKTTHLRMEGNEGHEDIELGPEQVQRMRDVLLVFRYLGGTWPAD